LDKSPTILGISFERTTGISIARADFENTITQ
jgi:hypothetical protein